MASEGPLYPGTVATEAGPSGDNDWVNPGNVSADDDSLADITAPTFDAGDDSFRLIASNFGFTIPAGSTIDGIVVEIERSNAAGASSDNEVRLYDSTATLVGDNKAAGGDWPTALTLATYGGAADTWTAGLDDVDVNDPDFGVAFIVNADAANTDIAVDFIRVTVYYTEPAATLNPNAMRRRTTTRQAMSRGANW